MSGSATVDVHKLPFLATIKEIVNCSFMMTHMAKLKETC